MSYDLFLLPACTVRLDAELARAFMDREHAHILTCFLAYARWKAQAGWMQDAGLGAVPRRMPYELAQIKSGDIVLPAETHDGR